MLHALLQMNIFFKCILFFSTNITHPEINIQLLEMQNKDVALKCLGNLIKVHLK